MSTLPSKAQLQQTISVFESQKPKTSNPLDVAPSQSETRVFVAQESIAQPIKRLIVLVPNVDMDEAQVAQKVWEMAYAPKLAVLLFSLCRDANEELQIQRRLINLAALIRDPRVTVETQIESGWDWLRGVKSVLGEGDVVLCHAEQQVGLRHKHLANVLNAMRVPVWTLSGIHPTHLVSRPRWLLSIAFWSVAMAIVAGFFYLQTQINALPDGSPKTIVLCLSVLVEIGSLYGWNLFFL